MMDGSLFSDIVEYQKLTAGFKAPSLFSCVFDFYKSATVIPSSVFEMRWPIK